MIPFFLPKIKQKKNKKKGKLIDPKTGLAFLGPFLLDHLGNFFKGKILTKDSEPLVFAPDEKDDIDSSLSFFDRFPEPSDKDYTKGKLKRFFVKDIPSNKVVELDKDSYVKQKRQNKPYRKFYTLDWNVKGKLQDGEINGFKVTGIVTKNQKLLDEAEKVIPGIASLVSADQYTKENQTQLESDKLGSQVVENLQTTPDTFVIVGTNIPYNGPYHIHPTLGPMVGPKHTLAEHPRLGFVGADESIPVELRNQEKYANTLTVVTETEYTGGTLVRSE